MPRPKENQQPTLDKQARLMLLGGMFASGLAGPAPAALAQTLTVNVNGPGTVTSSPPGIDCGPINFDCTEYYGFMSTVTLTAHAEPGAKFTGWSGACSGTINSNSCTVSLDSDKYVSAAFNQVQAPLSAAINGTCTGQQGVPISLTGQATGGVPPYAFTWAAPQGRVTNATTNGNQTRAEVTFGQTGGFNVTLKATDASSPQQSAVQTTNCLVTLKPPSTSSSQATNITISLMSPSRYRLLGTLVDANKQPACGLALASGRCVFTCGPGSLRCEGGTDSLPLGQFDLTDLPTEADGALNLQTFVFGSMPGLQVVQSDGTARPVDSGVSRSSSGAINTQRHEVSPGRHRLTGTLVDANNQPACGLALASGRCVFTCGPGSLRCEGGASNLPLGQFELTDLPAEANGALNLQTFVFGSLPGLQVVNSGGGGCSHTIDPTSQTFTYEGGTGTVTVSTPSGCTWTAQSNNDWITITAGARGTGPGQVTYTVASHSSSSQRRGTLTIAGQTLTVLQAPKSDDGGGGGGH